MKEAKELHRRCIPKFKKRKIITKGIDDLWAADLLVLDKYAAENNGKKYKLVKSNRNSSLPKQKNLQQACNYNR